MPSVEQSTTQVANLAIAACGISKPIADLTTDRSVAAQMCRTHFDICRRLVMKDIPWTFARKQIVPAMVGQYPTPEWNYAYQYPSDALSINRFMSWRLSNDTRQSRIPYALMQPCPPNLTAMSTVTTQPASGLWIYTNWPGANASAGLPTIMEYIFDNTNVAQWTDDFVAAYGLKLATLIAPAVTSGDPYGMKDKVEAGYQAAISKARAQNLNEEQRPQDPQSEFIRAREGDAYGIPGSTWVAEPAGFTVY